MNIEFFGMLYQFCDEGMVELRALPSKRRQFVPVESLFGLDEFCGKNGDNYYFGAALRTGAGGGTKKDITQIPALHADCDFKDTPRDILFEKIKQFPFKTSLIVKSGGGAHLYFILNKPVGQADIELVEDANRRIAVALGRISIILSYVSRPFMPGSIIISSNDKSTVFSFRYSTASSPLQTALVL